MSFDNFTQDELRNFADHNRMKKEIQKKDKSILHNIAHSIHNNRKVRGKEQVNPYEGNWSPETRMDVIEELSRIRDKYKLRVYRTKDTLFNERSIKLEEEYKNKVSSSVDKAVEEYKTIIKSSENFRDFVTKSIAINDELQMHRNNWEYLVKLNWIKRDPETNQFIFRGVVDYELLVKEREFIDNHQYDYVLKSMIIDIIKEKGWIPDINKLVDRNEILQYVRKELTDNLSFNNQKDQ
jgi:hypothetical protein